MSILAVLFLLGSQASAAGSQGWDFYENARFGTQLSYPSRRFTERSESENGDGVTLRAADGATLRVFGARNIEQLTAAAYVGSVTAGNSRYRHVSYRRVGRDFAVLSGTVGSTTYYERYAFGDPSSVVHAFVLEYPRAARATYEAIIPRMSRSLSWSARTE